MTSMNIGEAAAAAGVTPKMIRHYESLGMLPGVQRTDSGYRVYSPREVAMLRFIRQARALGFPMKQTGALLALWGDDHRASREVKALAQQHLDELQERQREIDDMRTTLSHLVALCKGDEDPHCAILEQLSGPAAQAGKAVTRPASKNLKEVRSGTRAAAPKPAAPASPHAGLMAWTRRLGQ